MTRTKKNSLPQDSWDRLPTNLRMANQNITNSNIKELLPKSNSPQREGWFISQK